MRFSGPRVRAAAARRSSRRFDVPAVASPEPRFDDGQMLPALDIVHGESGRKAPIAKRTDPLLLMSYSLPDVGSENRNCSKCTGVPEAPMGLERQSVPRTGRTIVWRSRTRGFRLPGVCSLASQTSRKSKPGVLVNSPCAKPPQSSRENVHCGSTLMPRRSP